MERGSTYKPATTSKANSAQDVTLESAAVWGKQQPSPKRLDSPAPPPDWTRYIDSRLKQFCTR